MPTAAPTAAPSPLKRRTDFSSALRVSAPLAPLAPQNGWARQRGTAHAGSCTFGFSPPGVGDVFVLGVGIPAGGKGIPSAKAIGMHYWLVLIIK